MLMRGGTWRRSKMTFEPHCNKHVSERNRHSKIAYEPLYAPQMPPISDQQSKPEDIAHENRDGEPKPRPEKRLFGYRHPYAGQPNEHVWRNWRAVKLKHR